MNYYKMKIAGKDVLLPIFPINEKISIAAFLLFDKVELTAAAAGGVFKKNPSFDVIFAPEAKCIPLVYEMAKQSGKGYVIARKTKKLYMGECLSVAVKSITTEKEQRLFIGELDVDKLKNKSILIVDDVISTGGSVEAVKTLAEKAGGKIAAVSAVLAEGEAADRDDIIFLEKLPLINAEFGARNAE